MTELGRKSVLSPLNKVRKGESVLRSTTIACILRRCFLIMFLLGNALDDSWRPTASQMDSDFESKLLLFEMIRQNAIDINVIYLIILASEVAIRPWYQAPLHFVHLRIKDNLKSLRPLVR